MVMNLQITRIMEKTQSPLYNGVWKWWRCLTGKEKLYSVYFLFSFMLVGGLADNNPLWVLLLAVLNFGNSVRLLKRVPTDKLEED